MVRLGSQSAGQGLDQQGPWAGTGTGTALPELENDTSVASLRHTDSSAELGLLSPRAGV